MAKAPKGHIRKRGERYEIAVPLGRDPVTKRYRYAYEYAADPAEAERKRDELVQRVADGRQPDSKATVAALLDRWMDVADLALSTRVAHDGYLRRTVLPVLGQWQLRKLQYRVDRRSAVHRAQGLAPGDVAQRHPDPLRGPRPHARRPDPRPGRGRDARPADRAADPGRRALTPGQPP